MSDDLAAGGPNLPLGYLSLEVDGRIKSYSPFSNEGGTPDPARLVGKHFFREIFTCADGDRLEQRFHEFVEGTEEPFLSANVTVKVGKRLRRIHVGFVRSPLGSEVIATVNPVEHDDLPLSAQIRPDPLRGTLADAASRPVIIGNEDFWRGLEASFSDLDEPRRAEVLHGIGMEWGLAHTVRVESFVQKERNSTLGELEMQIALEYLSGSLAVIGLGLFEVDLTHRQRGVVVIDHRASPFPSLLTGIGGRSCHLLAGFHAGVLSYLSGRGLRGFELACGFGAQDTCRFLVATDSRLHSLRSAKPHPADAKLLEELKAGLPAKELAR